MKPVSVIRNPALHHQPLGEQHPYQPLPTERSPRYPTAGEPVILGIETDNTPPPGSVWCIWQVDGASEMHRTEAEMGTMGETTCQWQVFLPAFNPYDIVRYKLCAQYDGYLAQTEEFSFSVSAWENVTSIVGYERSSDQVLLKLATTHDDLFVDLLVKSSPDDTLSFEITVVIENGFIPAISAANGAISAELGGLSLAFERNPFSLEIKRALDGLKLDNVGQFQVLVNAEGIVSKYRLSFTSPADEAFYGFGERFNALDQRGNRLDNYVFGQYTGQGKRTYIPVPFFISSRGYGLWLQTERQAEFDLAAAQGDRWELIGYAEEENARLEIKLFFQSTTHAIIQAFTALCGKPKLPPAWVFGLWMSSNDWNSQAEVLRQLHKTQQENIPVTVLVIEAWSDEINFYIWNDAQYQVKPPSQAYSLGDFSFPPGGHWPNPKAMVDEIHAAGVRLVLWQNPTIKQGEPGEFADERINKADQEVSIQQGFVVSRSDGTPHRVEAHMPWFRGSLVFDFSHPGGVHWWFIKRKYLVTELGVDGFKTDGGEHIWDPDARFFNGMRGNRGINVYPLVYEAAYQRFMQEHKGDDHVLFSRAGYTGVQQYSCHWAGDEISTWEAFRATVRALLNVGLCGVPFVGWDIAGFSGPIPGEELYLRATAFSVFCPIMQYHSEGNSRRIPSRDRTPWNIQEQTGDPDVIPIFRKFANLRMNLLPYILGQAYESSQSGLPLMRALLLEDQDDLICRKYPYEYMFGDALLVAPVLEEGATSWPVYLPEGDWRDLWTGSLYHGPLELAMDAPRDRIPVFQKKGSLIPLNLDGTGDLCSWVGNSTAEYDHLTLRIFPGGKIEASLIQSMENVPARIIVDALNEEGVLSIQLPELSEELDLVLYGHEPSAVSFATKPLPRLEEKDMLNSGTSWYWDAQKQEIRIHLSEFQAGMMIIR